MDGYDLLGLARLVRPLRHAIMIAFVVFAGFFRTELVARIMQMSDDPTLRAIDQGREVWSR